jgi:hypothetical protein
MTLVTHPDGVAPVLPLKAQSYGRDKYRLDYKSAPGAKADTDIWDTQIPFTGRDPHEVEMVVVLDGGDEDSETPTVADGSGGGGGTTKSITYKAKKLAGFKTKWVKRSSK